MAGIIKGCWESAKKNLAPVRDLWRVARDMRAGGCLDDAIKALDACDPRMTRPKVDGKPAAEVVDPAYLDACVKATAALRRCMQCRPDVFREHIIAMDKGIEEEERLRREPDTKVEDGPWLRWWTGMKNS